MIMAHTVKLFRLTQSYFQTLGICPKKPNQKYSFNLTTCFILLSMIVIALSTSAFFLLEAETVEDYVHTSYISLTEFGLLIFIIINIWKMRKTLQLITDYEKFIRRS